MIAAVDLLSLPQGLELVSYGDKRNPGVRKVCYASEVPFEYWAIDKRPYDSDVDGPLTDASLTGNARRLLGPVERDGIYCSPWCGFKCTKAAYDRAVLEAARLCEALGPGWEPRIWENGGWHFEAVMGSSRVTPDTVGSTIAGTYTVTGYTGWCNFSDKQTIERGSTPRAAIELAKDAMAQVIKRLQAKLWEVA